MIKLNETFEARGRATPVNGMLEPEFEPVLRARVAEVMPNMEARLFAAKEVETDTLRSKAFVQNPAEPWPVTLNSRIRRESEIASGNGHQDARRRDQRAARGATHQRTVRMSLS